MVLRILKMIATSGFLTALECTKFIFGRGSASGPTGGAYSAPPDPLAGLRGPTSKGLGERGENGRGMEREGPASFRKFLDPLLVHDNSISNTVKCCVEYWNIKVKIKQAFLDPVIGLCVF